MKTFKNTFLAILVFIVSNAQATDTSTENSSQNAQGAGVYQIKKYTLSLGGGEISGGNYFVTSSIGQIDAGSKLLGGIYEVRGGFLTGNSDLIFKNSFEQ